jgi:purine-nucleoside phosphorylase
VLTDASPDLVDALLDACRSAGKPATAGTVWTTDALYRETRAKIQAFSEQAVLAVDMETSAIFAVARHLGLDAAVLLLVSDELAGPEWQVGFHAEGFRQDHEAACRIAGAACGALATPAL